MNSKIASALPLAAVAVLAALAIMAMPSLNKPVEDYSSTSSLKHAMAKLTLYTVQVTNPTDQVMHGAVTCTRLSGGASLQYRGEPMSIRSGRLCFHHGNIAAGETATATFVASVPTSFVGDVLTEPCTRAAASNVRCQSVGFDVNRSGPAPAENDPEAEALVREILAAMPKR